MNSEDHYRAAFAIVDFYLESYLNVEVLKSSSEADTRKHVLMCRPTSQPTRKAQAQGRGIYHPSSTVPRKAYRLNPARPAAAFRPIPRKSPLPRVRIRIPCFTCSRTLAFYLSTPSNARRFSSSHSSFSIIQPICMVDPTQNSRSPTFLYPSRS